MPDWIEFRNGQYPRIGEIFVVRDESGAVYPHMFICKRFLDYRYYHDESTKMDMRGFSHWKLIEWQRD